MAGDVSLNGNPTFANFVLVVRKLEKLGFTYHKGRASESVDDAEFSLSAWR